MKYVLISLMLILSGCASNKALYFGTYTRVGIDASTNGAGVGVKNAALQITPPKDDGSAFDILGTTDMDIGYTYVILDEVVAVGDAAKCAANKTPGVTLESSLESEDEPTIGPVIFGAYTSWSLIDLSWGGATATGINFGYKRGVGVRMPIVNDTVGSVYAHVSINTTDDTTIAPISLKGGTRNKHTFATGEAAIIKASAEAKALNGGDASYAGCIQ